MVNVLFVCMGNICRSPSAEGVFIRLVEAQGLSHLIEIDSAGTHDYHVGGKADPRSIAFARQRGVDLNPHRARQVCSQDFDYYHYILAMDKRNFGHLKDVCQEHHLSKIRLFMEFAPHLGEEVPDPYYGGDQGFDHVLDLVEAVSEGLLEDIRTHHLSVSS